MTIKYRQVGCDLQNDMGVSSLSAYPMSGNLSLLDWTCHGLCRQAVGMTESGWKAIGRIARARRERLGLKQEDLADYAGPRVSTVGKFERAAQDSFPLRTQHQIEKALGWSRGIIEQVVSSIDKGHLTADDWEHDLVFEDVPDMSRPTGPPAEDGSTAAQIEAFASVFRLLVEERRDEALSAALLAILPLLDHDGATRLGRGLRSTFPPDGGDGTADDTGGSTSTSEPPVNETEEEKAARLGEAMGVPRDSGPDVGTVG